MWHAAKTADAGSRALAVVHLGRRAYGPTWELQKRLVVLRQRNQLPDTMLLVEHDPTYTIGRNGRSGHVLWDERQLRVRGVEIFRIDRGGDVTYHGPGQLVGYPIIDLRQRGLGVRAYIEALEAALIAVCRELGLPARREEGLVGVWIGDRKIAAIGVRVSRGVTSHGFAFNVSTDLTYFDGIIPCGIRDRGVTSLARELGAVPTWSEICRQVAAAVSQALGYDGWAYEDEAHVVAAVSGATHS
ncbi:MAG TPA: lipoyl(octanoyl) transferase LipB [Bacillota bacterium]